MSGLIDAAARAPLRPKAGAATKPTMEVNLDQHFSSKVYTSGSIVSGNVVVQAQARDTPFEIFDIIFTGVAATRLDFVQSYTTNSVRTFMKLRMPIPESDFPSPRIFRAGQTYTIPFHFVVPHQLTIGACNHGCEAEAVQNQHLRLPPTMGYWEADDQAPDMTHIEYAVRTLATIRGINTGEPKANLIEAKKIIKVLPALSEEPPLHITSNDERYCMSKMKTIRKNLLSAKMGELQASACEPGAIMLSSNGLGASSTTARVNLEFAPAAADQEPPKINSINGKIITTTFFGSTPQDRLPNFGSKDNYATTQLLTYTGTHNLFTNRIDKVSWTEHKLPMQRRDSGYETFGTPGSPYSPFSPGEGLNESDEDGGYFAPRPSKNKSKKSQGPPVRHRAQIELPVTIPFSNKKIFLPTFHSCIMSRVYVLQLTLSVGSNNTTISLSIPLQLGVEQQFAPHDDELPSFETAMAQAEESEADAHMHLPARPVFLRSNSVLPGYEEVTRRTIPA